VDLDFVDLHIALRQVGADRAPPPAAAFAAYVVSGPLLDEQGEAVAVGATDRDRSMLEDLERRYVTATDHPLPPADSRPVLDDDEWRQIREADGQKLFQLLFGGGSFLSESLRAALSEANRSVRDNSTPAAVRIKIDVAGRQSVLPWELLPLGLRGGIIGYGAVRTCVVRYAGTLRARHAPSGEASRVLFIACRSAYKSHADIGPLARREWERTQFLLRGAGIDAVFVEGPQVMTRLAETVADARSDRVRIGGVHIIGHGGTNSRGQGFVYGDTPNSQFTADAFLSVLRASAGASYASESLGFAMLNVCGGGAGLGGFARAIAMRGGVPQVLAYRHATLPDTAAAVAERFYRRVVIGGDPVETIALEDQEGGNPDGLVIVRRDLARDEAANLTRQAKPGDRSDGTPVLARTSQSGETRTSPPGVRPADLASPPAPSADAGPARENASEERGEPPAATSRHISSLATGSKPFEAELTDMQMVLIPAGNVCLGISDAQRAVLFRAFARLSLNSDSALNALNGERLGAEPLPPFYMSETQVTNAQFEAFTRATGHETTAERRGEEKTWRRFIGLDGHPVVHVSHDDARAFCRWAKAALPSEMQWKRTFRGNDGRVYPWGNTFDPNVCNTAESCRGSQTTQVRRFKDGRSPFGCYDMVGNVEEWTSTASNGNYAIFGGSWAMTCEVYGLPVLRRLARADFHEGDLGFRCVRPA